MSEEASNRTGRDRVVLVTGGARGIGAALGRDFAQSGSTVILVDQDADALEQTAAALKRAGGLVEAIPIDITQSDALEAAVAAIANDHGHLDVLVHNAGISPKHDGRKAPVVEMDVSEWRRVLEVNLTAVFRLSQLAIPLLTRAGRGRIILVSSQAARTRSDIAGAHYAASKAGLLGFARILAQEVAPLGITVNTVAPGRVATAMANAAGSDVNAAYARAIPVGRLGTPGDVAAAVRFLASPDADFLTGTILDITGGYFMP